MSNPESLFEEFARRYHRGEHPDPIAYLLRAGSDADALTGMIDAFLILAPTPMPDAQLVAALTAWARGDAPMVTLRHGRHLTIDAVVAHLRDALEIPERLVGHLKDLYQRLEGGLLDASRIDRRVLTALAEILGVPTTLLVPFGGAPTPDESMPRASSHTPVFRTTERGSEIEVAFVQNDDDPERLTLDALFGIA